MKKILYVEDDLMDFEIIFKKLKNYDIQPYWLPDIYSAYRYLHHLKDKTIFDLIIIDYLGTSSVIDESKKYINKIFEINEKNVFITSNYCNLFRYVNNRVQCIDKNVLTEFILKKLNV